MVFSFSSCFVFTLQVIFCSASHIFPTVGSSFACGSSLIISSASSRSSCICSTTSSTSCLSSKSGVESVSGLLSFSSFSSAFSFIISHTVPVSSFFIILSLKFSGRIVWSSHSVPKKPPDSVSKIIPPIFSRGIPEPPISIPSVSTRHSILFASVLQLPSKIPFISPSFRTNPYTLHTSPAARFPT